MRTPLCIVFLAILIGPLGQSAAQETEARGSTPPTVGDVITLDPVTVDKIIDRIIAREHYESLLLTHFHPVLQTRIWDFREKDGEDHPWRSWDNSARATATPDSLSVKTIHEPYYEEYDQVGFWEMAFVDRRDFDRRHYVFSYVGKEGDDFVFDVRPVKPETIGAHFVGRIWAEPVNYTIVRFNGTYTTEHYWEFLPIPHENTVHFFSFDSYRTNVQGDLWLPSSVTSEGKGLHEVQRRWDFKAQTVFSDYPVAQLSGMSLPKYNQQEFQETELPPVRLGRKFWTPWIVDAGLIVANVELQEDCIHTTGCVEKSLIFGSHPSRFELYSLNFGLDGVLIHFARDDRLHRRKFWADMETDVPLVVHGLNFLSQSIRVAGR